MHVNKGLCHVIVGCLGEIFSMSLKLENGDVEFFTDRNYRYITKEMILSKNDLYTGDLR